MLKTILMALLFFGLGYTMAVLLPMPADWQDTVKAPFRSDGVIGDSFIGEVIGTIDEPVPEQQAAPEEDKTQYATQSDLLVNPTDASVVYSVLLGEYPEQSMGDKYLEFIGFTEVAPVYIPFKDPLGHKTLLLLLGEFSDEETARRQERKWELQYDLNLQVVKKPVLPDPEAEAKQQQMQDTAEAISKLLAGESS